MSIELNNSLFRVAKSVLEAHTTSVVVERAELERLREFERVTRTWLSNPPHPGGEYLDGFIDAMASLGQRVGDEDWASDGSNEKRFIAARQEVERLQALDRKIEAFLGSATCDRVKADIGPMSISESHHDIYWSLRGQKFGSFLSFADAMRKAFELFEVPGGGLKS